MKRARPQHNFHVDDDDHCETPGEAYDGAALPNEA